MWWRQTLKSWFWLRDICDGGFFQVVPSLFVIDFLSYFVDERCGILSFV